MPRRKPSTGGRTIYCPSCSTSFSSLGFNRHYCVSSSSSLRVDAVDADVGVKRRRETSIEDKDYHDENMFYDNNYNAHTSGGSGGDGGDDGDDEEPGSGNHEDGDSQDSENSSEDEDVDEDEINMGLPPGETDDEVPIYHPETR
jgi:hypothetical protein